MNQLLQDLYILTNYHTFYKFGNSTQWPLLLTTDATHLDSAKVHWMSNDVVVVGLFGKCCVNRIEKQVRKALQQIQNTICLHDLPRNTYKIECKNEFQF